MEVERRGEPGTGQSLRAHHPRREVPDVLSWLQCFSIYVAVICSKWPEKNRQLFAYQEMILSEARRGGKGWLMYDSAFRQQITSLDTFDFSTINQSLYSTTCLQFGNKVKACVFCGKSDHVHDECALHPNKSLPLIGMRETTSSSPGFGTKEDTRRSTDGPRKKLRRGACFDWNSSRGCSDSKCNWEHK